MKTLTLSLIALALGVAPMKAQIFQPNVVNGALLGSLAGAIIGNNNGHHTGQGALIGAVGGAVLGSLVQPQPRVVYTQSAPVVYAQSAPVVYYTQPAPVVYEQSCAPVATYYPAPVYYSYGYGYRPYCDGRPYYYAPRIGISFGYRSGGGHHR